MISLDAARRIVLDACSPLAPVDLAVGEALGCVTAEPIVAHEPVPAFANSAMDGFALRAADVSAAPTTLRVVGTTMAGMGPGSLRAGEAIRIMTGAPVPAGADAVCMVERTEPGPAPDQVVIHGPLDAGTFIRSPGDDLQVGQTVIAPGTELGPGHLGVLASLSRTEVRVHRRPVVGVLSTGDELLEPPAPLIPGKIRDANRPSLLGLLRRSGFGATDLGVVPDDEVAIEAAVTGAFAACDAVIASGGVSVGDADLVRTAWESLCGDSARWLQVAIKPAKPFAFGVTPGGVPLFGVPGNPVSAMVSFELFARPGLRAMAGHRIRVPPTVTAVADEALRRPDDGKVHFLRVRAALDAKGRLRVRLTGVQQSHVLHAMAAANALAVVPEPPGIDAGSAVEVLLLDIGVAPIDPGFSARPARCR